MTSLAPAEAVSHLVALGHPHAIAAYLANHGAVGDPKSSRKTVIAMWLTRVTDIGRAEVVLYRIFGGLKLVIKCYGAIGSAVPTETINVAGPLARFESFFEMGLYPRLLATEGAETVRE
jgi:hypothetical protein